MRFHTQFRNPLRCVTRSMIPPYTINTKQVPVNSAVLLAIHTLRSKLPLNSQFSSLRFFSERSCVRRAFRGRAPTCPAWLAVHRARNCPRRGGRSVHSYPAHCLVCGSLRRAGDRPDRSAAATRRRANARPASLNPANTTHRGHRGGARCAAFAGVACSGGIRSGPHREGAAARRRPRGRAQSPARRTGKEGQELAVIDSGDLAQAYADIEKARSTITLTKKTLDRQLNLVKIGGGAIKDREQAQSDYDQALSELDRAQTAAARDRRLRRSESEHSRLLSRQGAGQPAA